MRNPTADDPVFAQSARGQSTRLDRGPGSVLRGGSRAAAVAGLGGGRWPAPSEGRGSSRVNARVASGARDHVFQQCRFEAWRRRLRSRVDWVDARPVGVGSLHPRTGSSRRGARLLRSTATVRIRSALDARRSARALGAARHASLARVQRRAELPHFGRFSAHARRAEALADSASHNGTAVDGTAMAQQGSAAWQRRVHQNVRAKGPRARRCTAIVRRSIDLRGRLN